MKMIMRHEDKYICTNRQLDLIEARLSSFLKRDSHQVGSDYGIRSLYFDTFEDRLLNESLSGVPNRKKYRIRIYNCSDERISLEEKSSVGNLKSKRSAVVTQEYVKEQLGSVVSGEYVRECSQDPQIGKSALYTSNSAAPDLLTTVHLLNRTEGLRPVVIVDYRRSAYIYDIGNVRITIDKDIGASAQFEDFFNPGMITLPVLENNKNLIEVKYDGILPGFIVRLLDIGSMEHVSFSKYALCRNVMENNGRRDEYYVI